MMTMIEASPAQAPLLTTDALAEALDSEARLIQGLGSLLASLRQAVAEDDVAELERCVYSNHRVLATISEARRRRTALADLLHVEASDAARHGLAPHYARLQEAATLLEREVESTRLVLRGALENGEAMIREVMGAPGPATYDRSAAPVAGSAGTQPAFLRQKA